MIYIVLHILCCVAGYLHLHTQHWIELWMSIEDFMQKYWPWTTQSYLWWYTGSVYISRYFALPDILHQVMGPGNNEVLDLGGWVPTGYK
jgi:hypothetical protein